MQTKIFLNSRSGVSLLIGIGLVAVILFFSLLVSNVVVSSIRQSANVNSANDAYYGAEGALEKALLINADGGVAFNQESGLFDVDGNTQASYDIQGRVPEDRKYGDVSFFEGFYSIPSPGGGDAGSNCDPVDAYYDKTFDYEFYTGTAYDTREFVDPAEHPCNWGILREGESVSIPLYATDDTNTVLNPSELQLSDLRVRVRTPCKNGNEMCPENVNNRYELETEEGDPDYECDFSTPIRCGDTIVAWTITGENINGDKTYYLGPLDYVLPSFVRSTTNSEIYELLINNNGIPSCGLFCVLTGEYEQGVDLSEQEGLIKDFLWDLGTFTRNGLEKINKPLLKLSVIHSLVDADNSGASVPYLEYQILTNAQQNPANSVQTITAEGYANEFKQTLEVKVPHESGILEYVIQQ